MLEESHSKLWVSLLTQKYIQVRVIFVHDLMQLIKIKNSMTIFLALWFG